VSASLDRLSSQFKEWVEQMKGDKKSQTKILRISEDMAESIKQWADLQGLSENDFLNYAIGFYILFSQESSKFAVGMTT
jgi:predicted DNA binding CopG/RHH family protein